MTMTMTMTNVNMVLHRQRWRKIFQADSCGTMQFVVFKMISSVICNFDLWIVILVCDLRFSIPAGCDMSDQQNLPVIAAPSSFLLAPHLSSVMVMVVVMEQFSKKREEIWRFSWRDLGSWRFSWRVQMYLTCLRLVIVSSTLVDSFPPKTKMVASNVT